MPSGIAAERVEEDAPFHGHHGGFQRQDERKVDFYEIESRTDGNYIIQRRIGHDACERDRRDFISAPVAEKPCRGSLYRYR